MDKLILLLYSQSFKLMKKWSDPIAIIVKDQIKFEIMIPDVWYHAILVSIMLYTSYLTIRKVKRLQKKYSLL